MRPNRVSRAILRVLGALTRSYVRLRHSIHSCIYSLHLLLFLTTSYAIVGSRVARQHGAGPEFLRHDRQHRCCPGIRIGHTGTSQSVDLDNNKSS